MLEGLTIVVMNEIDVVLDFPFLSDRVVKLNCSALANVHVYLFIWRVIETEEESNALRLC